MSLVNQNNIDLKNLNQYDNELSSLSELDSIDFSSIDEKEIISINYENKLNFDDKKFWSGFKRIDVKEKFKDFVYWFQYQLSINKDLKYGVVKDLCKNKILPPNFYLALSSYDKNHNPNFKDFFWIHTDPKFKNYTNVGHWYNYFFNDVQIICRGKGGAAIFRRN